MEVHERNAQNIVNLAKDVDPDPIIEVASGTVTYYGYAEIGTRQGDPNWLIKRVTIAGNVTIAEYSNGIMSPSAAWTARASVMYSR